MMATAVMIVAVVMFIVEMPADDGFSVVAPFYLCMLFDRFFSGTWTRGFRMGRLGLT